MYGDQITQQEKIALWRGQLRANTNGRLGVTETTDTLSKDAAAAFAGIPTRTARKSTMTTATKTTTKKS